jgi:cardiolipin synthase
MLPSRDSRSIRSLWIKRIPNLLTCLRILLAGFFPLAPNAMRLLVVGTALLTEYLDGALSRLLHAQTLLGQILDPVADKLFFGSVVITFWIEGRLSLFEVFLLGIRDIAVICVVCYITLRGRWHYLTMMKPKIFGKLTTAFQYGAFVNLIVAERVSPVVLAIIAISGVLAAGQYLSSYFFHIDR